MPTIKFMEYLTAPILLNYLGIIHKQVEYKTNEGMNSMKNVEIKNSKQQNSMA
jgi:hypothetical protein